MKPNTLPLPVSVNKGCGEQIASDCLHKGLNAGVRIDKFHQSIGELGGGYVVLLNVAGG